MSSGFGNTSGLALSSRRLVPQVLSPLQRFTAVFGMGTGGATALGSPEPSSEFLSLLASGDAIRESRFVTWGLAADSRFSI